MICKRCEEDKPEDEFHYRDKTTGSRKTICKVCTKSYRKEYYDNNREEAINYSLKRNREIKDRNSQYVWDYLKEHPCIVCGETDPVVLEFDHKDDVEKTDNVSCGVRYMWGLDKLRTEIEKCDVRCSNCHKRRTAEQQGWYKNIVK
jgi:hypothetical protein